MEQLRRIAALGDAVADLEMTPPRLEDLYRHYAKEDLQ
jgi:Cu-processing system ATP-binding protein